MKKIKSNAVKNNRWTQSEEEVLLRYVKANPCNLSKCFLLVSEHLTSQGNRRTPSGVQGHWYTVLSKKPEALCFFTASSKHVSKNRKNGAGTPTNESIWKKFMRILNTFVKD